MAGAGEGPLRLAAGARGGRRGDGPGATAPAPAPVAMPEPVFDDGNGAPTAHGDGNGAAHGEGNGHGDLDGPDRLVESHFPAPSGDEPGGPTIE